MQQLSTSAASKRSMVLAAVVIVLLLGTAVFASYAVLNSGAKKSSQAPAELHQTYSLHLRTTTFTPNRPTTLSFDIRDQNGQTFKDFDIVHEKKLHVIVVRKDRTEFQHVHPAYDEQNGVFTVSDFVFPTDGEYRVFADFTPQNAQKDEMGVKMPITPYSDVIVGDLGKYTPQAFAEQLTSSAGGFMTKITFPHGDTPNTIFWAKNENTFAVDIAKDAQPVTYLQTYLGALGHMVVLGPNLEFVHAHALSEDASKQNGLVYFRVNFPEPGLYKVYLQVQIEGTVRTFDYALTAQTMPHTRMPSQSETNMNHSGN